MAAEIQDYEPEKLTAGVIWKWSQSLSDYPASDWNLSYYLRINGATQISLGLTADGDTFQVNIAAGVKALFSPDVSALSASSQRGVKSLWSTMGFSNFSLIRPKAELMIHAHTLAKFSI